MNVETGEIKRFSADEWEKMKHQEMAIEQRVHKAAHAHQRYKWVPLTEREAEFFSAKGQMFRELWGKRIQKGLTVEQREQFDHMVAEFHTPMEP